jgi:hypothetical protein
MKHRFITLACAIAALAFPLDRAMALDISADGSGDTESAARADALDTLSSKLYSQIQSTLQADSSERMVNGKKASAEDSLRQSIVITSELPLLGTDIKVFPNSKKPKFLAKATLSSDVSMPLYETELDKTSKDIEKILKQAGDSGIASLNEADVSSLSALYIRFDKLEFVAKTLGSKQIPVLSKTKAAFDSEVLKQAQTIDSLAKAAKKIAQKITGNKIYVYPAKYNGRGNSTEFSDALNQCVLAELGNKVVVSEKDANFFFTGTYTEKPNAGGKPDISVSCRLTGRDGSVAYASPVVNIPPSVYAGYQYIPDGYDFLKQLESGNIVNNDFFVDMRVNGRKNDLSFTNGEKLRIDVKVSSPCYFYVVGYVYNEKNEQFSYLFPISLDAQDKDMFVRKVAADEANKWICINPVSEGEVVTIEIIPPFGVETLQVFASTEKDYQKFLDRIPSYTETDEFYLVDKNPKATLSKTRALNIKKKADAASGAVKNAEATLTYTSCKY